MAHETLSPILASLMGGLTTHLQCLLVARFAGRTGMLETGKLHPSDGRIFHTETCSYHSPFPSIIKELGLAIPTSPM